MNNNCGLSGVFCDWLTIYQQHTGDISFFPEMNGGRVVKLIRADPDEQDVRSKASHEDANQRPYSRLFTLTDQDGVMYSDMTVEYTVASAFSFEGSFDTCIQIRSEGGYVSLSGNIGRFERPDNVFGYSVSECIVFANSLLARFGLPPFTGRTITRDLEPIYTIDELSESKGSFYQKSDTVIKTGAQITRLDLTKNYITGSAETASRLLHYMGGMHRRNKAAKSYGAGGVTWGEGSKFWYAKLYNKAADMIKAKKLDERLYDWVLNSGMVRDEISLKSRFLLQNSLNEIGYWSEDMEMENVIYGKFSQVLTQTEVSVDDFESIPGRAGELAISWRNGMDLKERLTRDTFYRYRKLLKTYGLDISERCVVSRLPMRCEVIKMCEVSPPSWYQFRIA